MFKNKLHLFALHDFGGAFHKPCGIFIYVIQEIDVKESKPLFSNFVPVDILSKERFQLNALFQGKVKLSVMNFVILRVK